MIIYLSCDATHTFFIDCVKECVKKANRKIPNLYTLVYPPKKLGRETGKVRANILQIQQADVIIFDVTPSIAGKISYYNVSQIHRKRKMQVNVHNGHEQNNSFENLNPAPR